VYRQLIKIPLYLRLVTASLCYAAFQVVGHNSFSHTSEKTECARYTTAKIVDFLSACYLNVGIVRRTQNCDKHLAVDHFSRCSVNYLKGCSSVVDKHLVARYVNLPHHWRMLPKPCSVTFPER
jgi:hypothetical protein